MHANKLKKYFNKKKSCQKGMGLVQILIASVIIFIVGYGMVTMITFSNRQQKAQNVHANLIELQRKLDGLLNDQSSWAATLNSGDNTSMECLRNRTTCSALSGVRNRIHTVLDAGGSSAIITNAPDWDTPVYPSGGFTERGIPCATFNGSAGLGNDNCPFSYKIIWEPRCATDCIDPGFRVTARLIYNPSVNTGFRIPLQLGHLTDILDVASATADPTRKPINNSTGGFDVNTYFHDDKTGKYDVVVWRTASSNTKSFRVTTQTNGVCAPTLTARTIWYDSAAGGGYDPFELVTPSPTGLPTEIRFNKKGTYDCDVMGVGYRVNGFTVQLYNMASATAVGAGSAVAAVTSAGITGGYQSAAEFNTSFVLTNDGISFQVLQRCDLSNGDARDMGRYYDDIQFTPLPDSRNPTFASVTCTRID